MCEERSHLENKQQLNLGVYEFLSRSAIALHELPRSRLVDSLWLISDSVPRLLIAEDHRVKTQRTTELVIRINSSVVLSALPVEAQRRLVH